MGNYSCRRWGEIVDVEHKVRKPVAVAFFADQADRYELFHYHLETKGDLLRLQLDFVRRDKTGPGHQELSVCRANASGSIEWTETSLSLPHPVEGGGFTGGMVAEKVRERSAPCGVQLRGSTGIATCASQAPLSR